MTYCPSVDSQTWPYAVFHAAQSFFFSSGGKATTEAIFFQHSFIKKKDNRTLGGNRRFKVLCSEDHGHKLRSTILLRS